MNRFSFATSAAVHGANGDHGVRAVKVAQEGKELEPEPTHVLEQCKTSPWCVEKILGFLNGDLGRHVRRHAVEAHSIELELISAEWVYQKRRTGKPAVFDRSRFYLFLK